MEIKGIVVCVDYDDFLRESLWRNARHLTEIVVVTSSEDKSTQEIVKEVPSAKLWVTDAFTRYGEKFNKGAAIEEGFEVLGRDGWILIFDADIILPDVIHVDHISPDKMYGAPRRLLEDPSKFRNGIRWDTLPISRETGYPGYFQLFHGSCPIIANKPWYATSFNHAGGGDSYFDSRWPDSRKEKLRFDVLHLGPRDTNWFGRVSKRMDDKPIVGGKEKFDTMRKLLAHRGWRHLPKFPFDEKIVVPSSPEK